jgi:glyoxylase-like metal-dependent hydrolase (beta-lactamase superfamily II)
MSTDPEEPLRLLAPNPSPLTGPGTNTYLLGREQIAVIDPGPDDPFHLEAILASGQGRITHIFVTHAHRDHSGGAARLSRMTGAAVHAFGDALAGRSALMRRLAGLEGLGGGEGLDLGFRPDIILRDGDIVSTPDWGLRALHTPGHAANHLCFRWNDVIFTGDVAMGWSSTIISPPDGDLTDYFRSIARLEAEAASRLYPGHGAAILDPAPRLAELAGHRRQRTAQIIAALSQAPDDAAGLARRIYDIPETLLPAAARNVLAHLIALAEIGAVTTDHAIGPDVTFHLP